jgi:hypothetical protein
MFEDKYTEQVTVKIPTGTYSDGEPVYAEHAGQALITDFSRRDIERFGKIKNGKIFLLKCLTAPVPGAQVEHANSLYDIKDIRICRDLNGRIECYRCTVV